MHKLIAKLKFTSSDPIRVSSEYTSGDVRKYSGYLRVNFGMFGGPRAIFGLILPRANEN